MLLSWPQSLGVIAVVMCGIAAYICVYSAYLNLSLTRDTYYSQNRFADFEIMVDRAPETAVYRLESIPGVRQVRKRIVEDVNVDVPGIDEPRATPATGWLHHQGGNALPLRIGKIGGILRREC